MSIIPGNLPFTREGDYCFTLLNFLAVHGRLPKSTGGGLADALFWIMSGEEILDPLRVFVSDKVHLKDYVRAKVGDRHNVPTLAVIDSPAEALGFRYPGTCVIKPTHMSGEVILRKAGEAVPMDTIQRWFASNYYTFLREANYRHLRRRLIVEPFVFGQQSPKDYKIFCMHGTPLLVQTDADRHGDHTQNFYTPEWKPLPFVIGNKIGAGHDRPKNLDNLLGIARALSRDFNLIRIDLYTDEEEILVGEITNCHQANMGRFNPPDGEPLMTRLLFGEQGFHPGLMKRTNPGIETSR
jgi:TupA-like ATPgrasp